MLKYVIHDVTDMPKDYVTAHCISTDCAMGKGVVLSFRKKYQGLREACKKYVSDLNAGTGMIYRFESEAGVCYNLFTKDKWYTPHISMMPQYLSDLTICLRRLKQHMCLFGETKLAIPMLGCGLDRCSWEDVSKIIETVFDNSGIEIVVCVLSQDVLDRYNIKAS